MAVNNNRNVAFMFGILAAGFCVTFGYWLGRHHEEATPQKVERHVDPISAAERGAGK